MSYIFVLGSSRNGVLSELDITLPINHQFILSSLSILLNVLSIHPQFIINSSSMYCQFKSYSEFRNNSISLSLVFFLPRRGYCVEGSKNLCSSRAWILAGSDVTKSEDGRIGTSFVYTCEGSRCFRCPKTGPLDGRGGKLQRLVKVIIQNHVSWRSTG